MSEEAEFKKITEVIDKYLDKKGLELESKHLICSFCSDKYKKQMWETIDEDPDLDDFKELDPGFDDDEDFDDGEEVETIDVSKSETLDDKKIDDLEKEQKELSKVKPNVSKDFSKILSKDKKAKK